MAKEATQEFPYSRAKVWDALPTALSAAKMKVNLTDTAAGTVKASTHMSLRSWGENVEVRVSDAGADSTKVTVRSRLKFGLAGWGRHKKNVKRVFEALDRALR